jgi:hypothetical protein
MDAALRTPTPPRRRTRPNLRAPLARRDIERVQRARILLDVATVDLEAAEQLVGPFHATACHFRERLAEFRRDWDRLRAELGTRVLEAALAAPPVALVELDRTAWWLVLIGGRTYGVEPVPPTPLAPVLWRLVHLPRHEDGPYYAARLRDGTARCDCAEWTYQVADLPGAPPCKHLAALEFLGWL